MDRLFWKSVFGALRLAGFFVIAWAFGGGPSLVFCQSSAPESDAERLRTLAYGFLANRQALSDFVWEFERARCVADSIEDARAHRLTERYVRDGIWVVRGEAVRYELVCPSIEMERPAPGAVIQPGQWVAIECMSYRYLFDGHIRLSDAPGLHSANLWIGQGPPRLAWTPFSFGGMGVNEEMGPGNGILKGLSGEWVVRYVGREQRDGRLVDVVDVGGYLPRLGEKTIHRWFLDPAQGYLPLEQWYFGEADAPVAKSFVTEVRRTDSGVYYPHVSISLEHLDMRPPYRVDVYRTRSLRIGEPADEDFTLELAPGTNVIDIRDMRRSVSSREARSVGLRDLETLLRECAISAPHVSEEVQASGSRRGVMMVCTVVLVGLVALAATASGRRRRVKTLVTR